eukprot:603936-Prymnesium_polylepis.1
MVPLPASASATGLTRYLHGESQLYRNVPSQLEQRNASTYSRSVTAAKLTLAQWRSWILGFLERPCSLDCRACTLVAVLGRGASLGLLTPQGAGMT